MNQAETEDSGPRTGGHGLHRCSTWYRRVWASWASAPRGMSSLCSWHVTRHPNPVHLNTMFPLHSTLYHHFERNVYWFFKIRLWGYNRSIAQSIQCLSSKTWRLHFTHSSFDPHMSFPCLCPALRGGMIENPSTSALQSRTQLLKLWLVTPNGVMKRHLFFQNLQQPRTQNQAHNEFQSTLGVWGEDDTCVRNNIVGLLCGDWGSNLYRQASGQAHSPAELSCWQPWLGTQTYPSHWACYYGAQHWYTRTETPDYGILCTAAFQCTHEAFCSSRAIIV